MKPDLGIIGGSGLYEMEGLSDIEEMDLDTPFGKPSSPIMLGTLKGKRIAFLARHGLGHFLLPSEVNYRANIYALKSIGLTKVVSISAVGSLKEEYAPGHIIIPADLFDFTKANRKMSFFGEGIVGHVSVAEPYCANLSQSTYQAVQQTGATCHFGGTMITIEGPRFSTRAESHVFRSWGMDIIGMTTSPEAFLAREAGICYAVMAHITDYDVWHESEDAVTVSMVIERLHANVDLARQTIRRLAARLVERERDCDCEAALANALLTDRARIPEETREKLQAIVAPHLQ